MSESIVGKYTYFPDADEGESRYSEAADVVEIMRDRDSEEIEIRLNPGLNKGPGEDSLYIKMDAQALMAALVKVMLDLPERGA